MSNRRSESRFTAVLFIAAALAAGPGLHSAWADGPDPIDPDPKIVSLPQELSVDDPFSFTASVSHPGNGTLTNLVLIVSIETTGDAKLIVPSDSRFQVTDTSGTPLSAESLVSVMVLHPNSGYSQLTSNSSIDVPLTGNAGASSGQAIVHLGVSTQEAAFASKSSAAIPIE